MDQLTVTNLWLESILTRVLVAMLPDMANYSIAEIGETHT